MFVAGYVLLWANLLLYGLLRRAERRWLSVLALILAAAAWGLWTAGLVARGLAAGHWPVSTRYEFGLAFVWAFLGLHILATADHPRSGVGGLGLTLALATWVLTRPADEQTIAPLLPALRTVWFPLHTFTSAVAYGACGVAAGLGLTGLLGQEEGRDVWAHRMDRLLRWGFLWLTLSILLGALWARDAWGRWWGWDPKETWSLVVWLMYLLPLHLGPLPAWRGRRSIFLALLSFAGVLFLFLGVPWVVQTARLETRF